MILKKLHDSNLFNQSEYNKSLNELVIKFHSWNANIKKYTIKYSNVSEDEYYEFINSPEPGRYFAKIIIKKNSQILK